jgi:hypothetical protein
MDDCTVHSQDIIKECRDGLFKESNWGEKFSRVWNFLVKVTPVSELIG